MQTKLKKFLKETVAIVTLATVLLTFPSETFAKAKTVKALQCSGVFSENPATSRVHKLSEIPTIKSNTIVKTSSIDHGFVRYKVPKTGKYEIQITNYKCSDDNIGIYVGFSGDNLKDIEVSGLNNKGASFKLFTSTAFMKDRESCSSDERFRKTVEMKEQSDIYYSGKSITTNLKKGEYLYIQTWISGSSKKTINGSYKVYINKK